MTPSEPITVSELVRENIRRLRKDRGWSQGELADRLAERMGEPWTVSRVSDLEGGRQGRDRAIRPEELVFVALALQVSVLVLLAPPEGTRIRLGFDILEGPTFFELVTWLPGSFGADLDGRLSGLERVRRGEQPDPNTRAGRVLALHRRLDEEGRLVSPVTEDQILRLIAEESWEFVEMLTWDRLFEALVERIEREKTTADPETVEGDERHG